MESFKLACIESYGEDTEWVKFAKQGIFCHNADLISDVRIPLERLMRSEKPRVIIATSTLGQGVNLGVSTVIFSTLYQSGPITKRDFWNIAGRAGRAFVDHEGKILVAHDITKKDENKINWERKMISAYLNKSNIDRAESGCLELIRTLKTVAQLNGIAFDNLINLLAENRINEIDESLDEVNDLLDLIDDGLLSLHNSNNFEGNTLEWIDSYFTKSLAYIQAQYYEDITGDEVLDFIKARIKGITKKVGIEKSIWESIVSSGIPINSDLQIDEKLSEIISIVQSYIVSDKTLEERISLLENIEDVIRDVNIYKEKFEDSVDIKEIRKKWLSGISMSDIVQHENAVNIVTQHYSFNMPWVLNGISKKMKKQNLIEEADTIEELAILVELGLPNIKSVKIYQAGIRSRISAYEIANLYDDDLWEKSIRTYKQDLIDHADYYKNQVSENAALWIDLLVRFSKRKFIKIKKVPNFRYGKVHKRTKRLMARIINDKQYLVSPNFSVINEIGESDIDFSKVSNINGIYFDYDKLWKITCMNPYVVFT